MILLQCYLLNTAGGSHSHIFFVKMVFKFPMYAVYDLKTKISGNYLILPFSDGCNNKQGNLHHHLFMLLET